MAEVCFGPVENEVETIELLISGKKRDQVWMPIIAEFNEGVCLAFKCGSVV